MRKKTATKSCIKNKCEKRYIWVHNADHVNLHRDLHIKNKRLDEKKQILAFEKRNKFSWSIHTTAHNYGQICYEKLHELLCKSHLLVFMK